MVEEAVGRVVLDSLSEAPLAVWEEAEEEVGAEADSQAEAEVLVEAAAAEVGDQSQLSGFGFQVSSLRAKALQKNTG